MKKVLSLTAALATVASASLAQGEFTVPVTQNGVSYSCAPDIVMRDGVKVRRCIRADGGAATGNSGIFAGGLSTPALVGLGVLFIAVAATALDDDDDSTNGTN